MAEHIPQKNIRFSSLPARGFTCSATVAVLIACAVVAVLMHGCAPGTGDETGTVQRDETTSEKSLPPYPGNLSPESSPSDVARTLIEALDEEDEDTLLGLVAAKNEAEAISAIYRKHGRKKEIAPETAARMAAAGWSATYLFLQKGQTKVMREEVKGDKAYVFAEGKSPVGKLRKLKIKLIREDGVWKARGGIETLD